MKVLSLFANVGFGEFFLKENGFEVVVMNELLQDRVDFYNNFYEDSTDTICGDICDDDVRKKIINSCKDRGPIDLIIATPPCQGMSIANAQRASNDIRNKLIIHAVDIFNQLKPKYMLIENVPAMPNTYINYKDEPMKIIDFINEVIPSNYICKTKVLNGKHFGTAQSRSRSICLISEDGKWNHPTSNSNILTLKDVIGDKKQFPSLKNAESSKFTWHFASNHNDNHIEWMSHTKEGQTAFDNPVYYPSVIEDGEKRMIKGFKTTYKRISWNDPAPTVTMTNGSISSQNNVHPGHALPDGTQSDARVLSVRELLAVCGLPINCLDKFSEQDADGNFKYKYSQNFIRKVLGELFLPKMCLSLLDSIPEKRKA